MKLPRPYTPKHAGTPRWHVHAKAVAAELIEQAIDSVTSGVLYVLLRLSDW